MPADATVAVDPLIVLSGISKTYALERGGSFRALDTTSLRVGAQQFISLIGPSGCGKSTLLSIIAGLLEPSSGEVRIAGHAPKQARQSAEIGMVFQQPVLLPWRTIRRNVGFLSEIAKRQTREAAARRVDEMLGIVGLSAVADRYPHQLSGGMRQRTAIARALCLDPVLLLMDEPFGALDEFTRLQMNIELLRIWSQDKKTIVFVTHNVSEAVFLSDRVIAMAGNPGRVIEEIAIDLPRPRPTDVRYTSDFTDYVIRLQKLLETDIGLAKGAET